MCHFNRTRCKYTLVYRLNINFYQIIFNNAKYYLQRRSHQFTGLINAIVKLLCNVQQKVGYCDKGYINSIIIID